MTEQKPSDLPSDASTEHTNPRPDGSRREAIARLLSVAAGGAALQALAGCLAPGAESESEAEDIDTAEGALSGLTYVWTSTIGTSVSGGNLRGHSGGSTDNLIAIVGGHTTIGDGGGGLFYWDPTGALDDGGTTIVSGQNAGSTTTGAAWRRIYSGPLDVCWFGADRTGNSDSAPGIQRAIQAALLDAYRPKAVHLPAGRYVVYSSVQLPRLDGLTGRGFEFFGDGVQITMLEANTTVAPQDPTITFDATSNGVADVVIRDMTVIHNNRGYGIAHFSNGTQRAERIALRDLFVSTYTGATLGQYSPIYLHRVASSRLDRIRTMGGETSLFLRQCARCTVVDFITGLNSTCTMGIRIEGEGGDHHILRARIEECGTETTPGTGILIQADGTGSPTHVVIESTNFEGGLTEKQVHIKDGTHITLLACHTASSPLEHARGIVIGDGAHHVRMIGGSLRFMYAPEGPGAAPNKRAVAIASGATDIFFDTSLQSSGYPDIDLEVHHAAKRVRMNLVLERGNLWHEFQKVVGVVADLTQPAFSPIAGEYWVQRFDGNGGAVLRIPGAANVYDLKGGYEGQVVSILADSGGTLQPGGNINLAGGLPFAPNNPYSTITLLCYRTENVPPENLPEAWREVSRSVNL